MVKTLKNILFYSILFSLLLTSEGFYFAEKLTEEKQVKTTQSSTTGEKQEKSTVETQVEEVEQVEPAEKGGTKKQQLGTRALGDPFKPQHLLMHQRSVRFKFHTPDGTPIEGLDLNGEMVDYLAGNTLPTGYQVNLVYNSATQFYEGWMDYPHPIPPTTTQSQGVALQVKIENIPSVTAITEDYPNTYTLYERRAGTSSMDPDNMLSITGTANVQFANWGSGNWGKRLDDSESFSAVVWSSPTPISSIAYVRNRQTSTPYSHTLKMNMSEHFVDDHGNSIPAPSGFSNGRQWDVPGPTTYQFGITGAGGMPPADVPMEYVSGWKTYKYEGWYKGLKKPATLNTTHPITVPVNAGSGFPISVVYKAHYKVTEKYLHEGGGGSLDSGAFDSVQPVPENSLFAGTPQNVKKISNGDYYVYQGWLKDNEHPLYDMPRLGRPNETVTKDVIYKYIYKKATPNRSLTLAPDVSVVASGDQVTWTAKVKNTSSDPISLDDTDMRLDSVPDYVANSTIVDGVPQADSFWTGTSIPLIGPSGEITIQFKTQPSGAPNSVKETVISAQSVKLAQDIVKGQVRIKDEDSKPVPPTADIGLENVPSKFTFEDVTVNNYSQVSLLKLSSYASHTISDGLFVRLFDDRAGVPGWKLTAKLDSFKQAAHPSRTLSTGVSMDFKPKLEQVNNPNTSTETIDPSPAGSLPTIQSTVHLSSNNTDVLVMNSPIGIGDGTWQARIPLNDVQLTLPANSGIAGETYESTLTWTLSDAP
ncbi:WxL domain-containing protein [Candidatus Enterococcus murrayae]|uniref:WxL domain-containing protein n=1 Tax=Candidatus Enterococcus murrayae TaxID=2815321 RepID=A0ABS3HGT9_9ENTE|nr:WxL domain-containing protein [Enterococcus sp. MJM16]MBO0452666.1 WxL domain-containing protein [Enterococcus sp. MJM16]